jgi:hypothetical protein
MLGRTDVGALFFDGAKVPSMTAVSHCNRRRSSNFAMNACQIRRQVPSLSSASVGASWWTGFGTPRADRATVRRSSAPFFMDHVEQEHETVRRMPCTGALAWIPKEIRSIAELCSGEQAHSFVRGLTLCHTDALVRTLVARSNSLVVDSLLRQPRAVVIYCCAVPFTTSANGSSSADTSCIVAENVQCS